MKYVSEGCISSLRVNTEDDTVHDTILRLEDVLQAVLGSEALPTDIKTG